MTDDTDLEAASYLAAGKGRNDPNFLDELEDILRHQRTLEARVQSVQVIGGYDPHVRVRAGSSVAKAREVADAIGRLSDAPVVDQVEYRAPNGVRQPPQHRHYRDDSK